MSAPTDAFIDNFVGGQRTQEAVTSAVTDAVRTWTDTFTGIAGGQPPALPDAQVVVDRWFDVAQTVLDTQKAFAKSVVGAGTQAAEVVTEQATQGQPRADGRRPRPSWARPPRPPSAVGEQAASTARAARNATAKKS